MSAQFVKFLITGGIAAFVNVASRYVLNRVVQFEVAVALAYLVGMTTAYVLTRNFVFEDSGRAVATEFRRFATVNLFGLVVVWIVSVGLARLVFPAIGFVWHADDVAHLIGVLAPAVTSYLGHKHYTFGRADV